LSTRTKPWYLYVLRCSDDTFYTGVTTNINRRLHEHNNTPKGAKYTRSRRPVELIYSLTFSSQSTAQAAEAQFKKMSRKQKSMMIFGMKNEKG